jgi:hypothetical protein
MPLTRTTQGLIYFDELDSPTGYTFKKSAYNPHSEFTLDTSDKKSGTASFKDHSYAGGQSGNSYCAMCKNLDVGSGSGRRVHVWHKMQYANCAAWEVQPFRILKSTTEWYVMLWGCGGSSGGHGSGGNDWHEEAGTITDQYTGVQYCGVAWVWMQYSGDPPIGDAWCWADRLVICLNDNVTITNLIPGQKVELYRASDNVKIGEATCQEGQTSVAISIDGQLFPLQLYVKIYGTDGETLIETTQSYQMCGGDVWEWYSGTGPLNVVSDVFIIHRQAAAGEPKTANITATLKTNGGAPYEGKTVYFYTTLGTILPSSDTTDENGEAHAELTGETHGIAVVKAQWLGDENAAPATAHCVVHIFYEAESGDSEKDFQFYCEGIEYVYCAGTGRYSFNEEGKPDMFEVEIPEWLDTITDNGLVNIYRKGIQEFAGVLKHVEWSLASTRVLLSGSDVGILLDTTAVELQMYEKKTPDYMINDLLTKYQSGITPGSLATYPDPLYVTIDTESLLKAITRIVDQVGWVFRTKHDRTLDFADNFTGGATAAVFVEGENIFDVDRVRDYYALRNWIRMKGDGITSTKQDSTNIGQHGLLQGPAYQSKISDQATLDIACQAELDLKKVAPETIALLVFDDYPVGTYGCEDQVTVEVPSVGLSGYYTVKSIERDMSDAGFACLELSNRSIEYWELDEAYRRMTKDLSV